MRKLLKAILPFADLAAAPLVFPAALLLKAIRRAGVESMPWCRRVLGRVGVLPVRDHYHEPYFDARMQRRPLDQERALPGIDWNEEGQLELLKALGSGDELAGLDGAEIAGRRFSFGNGQFESGDAEIWYGLIRLKRPARVIEIGSGFSTLIALLALRRNTREDSRYRCRHVCVEPYQAPWLEGAGVTVVRKRVEELDKSMFAELGRGDILFIDSSHVIRPQGDVLFEYLELLPSLKPGVLVHVHDIFSPRDYPKEWVLDQARLWNEQYLLEAFLTGNRGWRVAAALNFLHHRHYERLRERCPYLTPDREPGSLYLERVG
jgi:predicted O-methyltransferase YrrM